MPEVPVFEGFTTRNNAHACFFEPLEPRLLLSVGSAGETQCLANWPQLLPSPIGQADISDSVDSPAVLGLSADGSATVDSAIDASGDVDVLKIVANVTGQMTFAMSADAGSGVDSFLEILDCRRQPIGSDDNSGGGLDASVTLDVQSGSAYYIKATGIGSTAGGYALSVTTHSPVLTPDPGPLPLPIPAGLPGPAAYSAAGGVTGQVVQTESGPVLVVRGTDGDDTISLSQSDTTITLAAAGVSVGSFSPSQSSAFSARRYTALPAATRSRQPTRSRPTFPSWSTQAPAMTRSTRTVPRRLRRSARTATTFSCR